MNDNQFEENNGELDSLENQAIDESTEADVSPVEEAVEETAEDPITAENDAVLQKELHDAVVSKQGLVADKFDEEPQLPSSVEELDEFEGKAGVDVRYGFNADEVKKALFLFQKDTIYRKNIIYSLIVAILFFVYLAQVLRGDTSKFAMMVCVLTVAVLGMIWYFPIRHITSTVKAIASQEYREDYLISFYDNAVVVGEADSRNVFYYKDNLIKAWETEDLFVLGYARQRIFVVPKRCCGGQSEQIAQMLKSGLGKQYRNLIK